MRSSASLAVPRGWWRLSLQLPWELEDSFLWKLPELGVTRVAVLRAPETPQDIELVAWLPESDWPQHNRTELERALQPLAQVFGLSLPPLRWQRLADEDWSLTWKQHWAPDPIGGTLLVLPAWLSEPPEAGQRHVIRMDPGLAFGTGSHPTTRLCMEGLEALGQTRAQGGKASVSSPLAGLRVADLGCGSGLLGLAALAMGAEGLWAVDTDPVAIHATQHNADLNGWTAITIAQGSSDELEHLLEDQPVDILLCNILAPVIAELCGSFSRLLKSNGRGLLSGLLVNQAENLMGTLKEKGWKATLAATQEEWALLAIERDEAIDKPGSSVTPH